MNTADILSKRKILSFEVFPPKPDAPEDTIYKTLDGLTDLKPDFISVTFGAGGGSNCGKTIQIASDVKHRYGVESVAHLPGINLTKEEARFILAGLKENGINNILALRGDVTPGQAPRGEFAHADELISFIKQEGDFHIMAACYPEVHPEAESAVTDIHHLKGKVDCGASHLISQLFLDNDAFYSFRERAAIAGINVPIEAGIMPVTNKKQIERMVSLCGASLPKKFLTMLNRYENNPIALRDAGIAYAIDQIVDLITHDVDGIHLYTMNSPYVARRIYEAVYTLLDA